MQMTKKVVSVVLAVMMVMSMIVVGTVSASAAGDVAQVNGTKYESLQDAIDAAANDDTITLLADISDCADITISKNLTIDLNDKNVTFPQVSGNSENIKIYNDAAVTVKNGTLNLKSAYVGFRVTDGTLTIASDAVVNADNGVFVRPQLATDDVTINVYGAINATQWCAIGANGTASAGGGNYVINVYDGASVVSTSTSLAPSMDPTGIYHCNSGALNVYGGTIQGRGSAVYIKSGTTNIVGGTFIATDKDTSYTYNGNGCYATGEAIVVDNCEGYVDINSVSITGGTFTSANGADKAIGIYAGTKAGHEAQAKDFVTGFVSGNISSNKPFTDEVCASGFIPTDDGSGNYGVKTGAYVTQVGGTKYESLAEAVAAANDGDTIKVLADTSIGSITNAKNITIDFNGKKVTTTVDKGFKNTGTLVFEDNSTNADGGLVGTKKLLENSGTLTINSGVYKTNNAPAIDSSCAFYTTAGSTFTVNGGTIDAYAYGIWPQGANAKVVVNDGTITSQTRACITGNGTSTYKDYVIEVNGGIITSNADYEDGCAIYHPNAGNLTITGGTITGSTGVYIKAGNADIGSTAISGATIRGTGTKKDYKFYSNGCYSTGDAIVIENCGYPGGTPSVTISNGTFTSDNAKAVASYVKQDDTNQTGSFERVENFVSGGTFNTIIPIEYIADDNICVKAAEAGKFTIGADTNPLNSLEAVGPVDDGNQFGINNDYLAGSLIGVQRKDKASVGAPETSESGQEDTNDMRFVAVIDTALLKGAEDYGFVLAKVPDTKTTVNFDNLKAYWGNGEKTVSAKDTKNNVCGDEKYGDPDDSSTAYKYVTCAVNGVETGYKIVARFFVKKDGKTYYGKYAKGGNYDANVTGALVGMSDLVTA